MFGWICAAALAQDRMVDDFNPPATLQWTDVSPIHSGIAIPTGYFYIDDPLTYFGQAWLGDAGICLAQHPMGGDCEVVSSGYLVTHTALEAVVWSEEFPDDYLRVNLERTGTYVDQSAGAVQAAWEVRTIDTTFACGQQATVEWIAYGSPNALYGMDDVKQTGAVCPQYTDGDGDGLCPNGTDTNGNGACVGPGELAAAGVVVDCDDAVAGTSCLFLVQDPPVVGQPMVLTVSGAIPGERVRFAIGDAPAPHCPPRLGGLCLDLGVPLGSKVAIADAAGVATVTVGSPSTPVLSRLYAQAVVARGVGGVDSLKSNLASDFVWP